MKLQDWLVQAVDQVTRTRGVSPEFYRAWTAAGGRFDESREEPAGALGEAAMRFRDDGVRIVVELFATASVLAALGEFPFPSEGQTD